MLIALTNRCFVRAAEIVQIHAPGEGSVVVSMRNGDIHQIEADHTGTQPTVLRLAREVNNLLKEYGDAQ